MGASALFERPLHAVTSVPGLFTQPGIAEAKGPGVRRDGALPLGVLRVQAALFARDENALASDGEGAGSQ